MIDFIRRIFGNDGGKDNPGKEVGKTSRNIELACPRCLAKTQVQDIPFSCSRCNEEIPPLYARDHQTITVSPIQVFGLPLHGKTVFLYALTLMLKRLERIWAAGAGDFTVAPISEESREIFRKIDNFLSQGKLPAATPLNQDEVYIALLHDMMRWRNRAVCVRDTAGEAFDHLAVDTEQARFLLAAPTIFMVISLPDSKIDSLLSFSDRMVSYINTLVRHRVPLTDRNVVVILSKADLITDLPDNLRQYLINDPLAAVAAIGPTSRLAPKTVFDENGLTHYLEGMKLADQEIRKWLRDSSYGNSLDRLAKHYGIEVRYTLISATGGGVDPGQSVPLNWLPKRVLDPFFWLLELEDGERPRKYQ